MNIFLTIPQQQVMVPAKHHPGAIEAQLSWTPGASNNAPPGETQQQRRHQIVHRNAAIVATEHLTPEAHSKMIRKTRSSKYTKQNAIGCESIHIDVDDGEPTVYHPAGVRRELHEQFFAACNGNPPWSTKAFVRIVREIKSSRCCQLCASCRPSWWSMSMGMDKTGFEELLRRLRSRIWSS